MLQPGRAQKKRLRGAICGRSELKTHPNLGDRFDHDRTSLTTKRVAGAARCLPRAGVCQNELLEHKKLFQVAGVGPTELFYA